jgi:hypothetical protein
MVIDICKAYGIEIENKVIENENLDWVNNKEEERLLSRNDFRNDFLKLIERFDIGDFSLDPDDYSINILFSGICVLSKHNKDKQKSFISYCYSINKAIDGFKEMAQEWTLIYSELKFHKTQREWVKKCFVVKNLNENEGKKIEVKKINEIEKKNLDKNLENIEEKEVDENLNKLNEDKYFKNQNEIREENENNIIENNIFEDNTINKMINNYENEINEIMRKLENLKSYISEKEKIINEEKQRIEEFEKNLSKNLYDKKEKINKLIDELKI